MTPSTQRSRSSIEWVTLALSVLIVGAFVLVALSEESRRQGEPGVGLSFTFDKDKSKLANGSYYVPYTVINTGANAISSADVWIEVFDDDALVEAAEITVEFLPLQGQQRGIYVSAFNPNTHRLSGRLESLQFP